MEPEKILINYLKVLGYPQAGDVLSSVETEKILYHLTHQEEKENLQRDEWGNWEHRFTSFDYRRPFIDEMVIERMNKAGMLRNSIWPNNHRFAFCLTHDLDVVSQNDLKQLSRRYKKLYNNATSAAVKAKLLMLKYYIDLKSLIPHTEDPLWNFEKWNDLEKEYGYSSTYYVFNAADHLHLYDCEILMNDMMKYRGRRMTIEEYIQSLVAEGFEIGVHGSFFTFNNGDLFKKQKKSLERITRGEVNTTRQHYLHYDINSTPAVHAGAGIKTDSTLGFNCAAGYRAGTCFPYYLADKLIEVPQVIMDGALFNSNSLMLDEKGAKKMVSRYIDQVERAGGCLVVNFHPNYLGRPAWWNTYVYLLDELKKRNGWCASMENIYKLAGSICAE